MGRCTVKRSLRSTTSGGHLTARKKESTVKKGNKRPPLASQAGFALICNTSCGRQAKQRYVRVNLVSVAQIES